MVTWQQASGSCHGCAAFIVDALVVIIIMHGLAIKAMVGLLLAISMLVAFGFHSLMP